MTSKSLSGLLFDQVGARPHHEAVIHDTRRVSYADLWQRIERVSTYLEQRDIGPGDRVLLLLENSVAYVAAYYGILRLGAVAVALNTGLKGAQLAHIIDHAQASLIFCDGDGTGDDLDRALTALAGPPPKVVAIQEALSQAAAAGGKPERTGDIIAADDALSSIIYTSGTTGRPKGVMLSANNLLSNTRAIVDYLDLQSRDRVLCVLPFYYAYGNSVLHTHLSVGATLVLGGSLMYPQRVLQTMADEKVSGFAGVPSTFRLLLQRCDLSQHPLPGLRYLTQAGGAMAPKDIESVMTYWPSAEFFVMYGQTEATARLSYVPPERLRDKPGSVGIPVAGVRIKIMNERGEELPRGQTGEICAAGPNIMLGYWRDPVASEAKFFGEWLRTGDLGFQDEEGFTTVVGRGSDMIKTGDHRVAPEEVEQIIAALPGVEEVAVVGAADAMLGQVIKAFVVISADCTLERRDIMRHCKMECATYKIPREVQFVPDLPKTASGKVQRYKLLEIDRIESFTEDKS